MRLPNWLKVIVAALGATTLPGCDYLAMKDLKPGVSSAAEVRSRMGEPVREYRNTDGSVIWEFNRQPNGVECYMITIGPDQIMRSFDQVLTESNMAKITVGMDRDEVRRLLGGPGSVVTYPNSNEEVWDWRVAGTLPTEEAHFHVHFNPASGLVIRSSRRIEVKG